MKIKLDSEIIKNRRTTSAGFKTKQLSRWQQLLQCNNFTISSLLELWAHHSSCERHGLRGQTRIHSMIRIGFSGFFGLLGFSVFLGFGVISLRINPGTNCILSSISRFTTSGFHAAKAKSRLGYSRWTFMDFPSVVWQDMRCFKSESR